MISPWIGTFYPQGEDMCTAAMGSQRRDRSKQFVDSNEYEIYICVVFTHENMATWFSYV